MINGMTISSAEVISNWKPSVVCKRLSLEERQDVVVSYLSGEESTLSIAKKYAMSDTTVRNLLREQGITPFKLRHKLSTVDEDRIIELYLGGLNTHDVADEMGIVSSTVFNALKRRGVPRRACVKRKKLSLEQRFDLAEQYANGKTFEYLYDAFSVSNSIVESCLDEFGVQARTGWGRFKTPEWTDVQGRVWVFKSTWELKYAQWLDSKGYDWVYEPAKFGLKKCTCYTPDFRVTVDGENEYHEVKGWMDDATMNRLVEFFGMYPDKTVRIIGPADMASLDLVEGYYVNHKMAKVVSDFKAEHGILGFAGGN